MLTRKCIMYTEVIKWTHNRNIMSFVFVMTFMLDCMIFYWIEQMLMQNPGE